MSLGSSWLNFKRRVIAATWDTFGHINSFYQIKTHHFSSKPHHQMVIIWQLSFFIYPSVGSDKTTPNSTSSFAPKPSDHVHLRTLLCFKMMFGLSDSRLAQMSNHNKPCSEVNSRVFSVVSIMEIKGCRALGPLLASYTLSRWRSLIQSLNVTPNLSVSCTRSQSFPQHWFHSTFSFPIRSVCSWLPLTLMLHGPSEVSCESGPGSRAELFYQENCIFTFC